MKITLPFCFACVSLLGLSLISVKAQPVLSDSTNITLTSHGTTPSSGFPIDQTPAGATALGYTPTDAVPFAPPFSPAQLNSGLSSPGTNYGADGGNWDIESAGTLTLTFAQPVTINSIAIYNGYDNRDDGTYTLSDAASDDLGQWTISTANDPLSGSNLGLDDFLLSFKTPVTTSALTLTFTNLTDPTALPDDEHTASFEDIQVFGSVAPAPEPSVGSLLLAGFAIIGASAYLRRAARPGR